MIDHMAKIKMLDKILRRMDVLVSQGKIGLEYVGCWVSSLDRGHVVGATMPTGCLDPRYISVL